MKPNLSVDNIKNETKRYNSSTDIQSILNRKTSTCKKENNKDKDNDYNKNNDFICNHNSNFISFCESCSLDLCSECEKNHINHKIIEFNDIIPNKEEINKINNTIKKYSEDYSKLIEEIYNWKKDLDKKIFYFEEQIKNNNIINKNLLTNLNLNNVNSNDLNELFKLNLTNIKNTEDSMIENNSMMIDKKNNNNK